MQTLASSQSLSTLQFAPHRAIGVCRQVPKAQLSAVHASPSSQLAAEVPTHVPILHTSPVVHALPSSQGTFCGPGPTTHAPELLSQPSLVQRLPSLQTVAVPEQVPALHTSATVQAFPSLQAVPLIGPCAHAALVHVSAVQGFLSLHSPSLVHVDPQLAIGAWLQVPPLQASTVHGSASSQLITAPTQTPAVHASGPVHTSPSEQATPFAVAAWPHAPEPGLQVSTVHGLLSVQLIAVPPWHLPPLHWSLSVHASPSSQTCPLAPGAWAHWPVPGEHASTVHGFLSSQVLVVPTQSPARHASAVVQLLASLQADPSARGVCAHFPALQLASKQGPALEQSLFWPQPPPHPAIPVWAQVPVLSAQLSDVQALLSSQSLSLPTHLPPRHASRVVQGLPSSQPPLAGADSQSPVLGLHAADWHVPAATQFCATPAQTPDWHVSANVHGLASSQELPLVAVCSQAPVTAAHESLVHGFPSSHLKSLATHCPFRQASPVLHSTPSSQSAPSATAWPLQPPVVGSQASAVHALPSLHATTLPTHSAALHTSPPVQGLPSSHGLPSPISIDVQVPAASQLSCVQGLPSLQSASLAHVSPPHEPLGTKTQALFLASQLSAVHRSPSSHTRGVPGWHTPALHSWSTWQNPDAEQVVPSSTGTALHCPETHAAVVHQLAAVLHSSSLLHSGVWMS